MRRRAVVVAVAGLAAAMALPAVPADPAPASASAGFELALVDLRGRKQSLGALPASVFAPRLSPDGRQVLFELADEANADAPASTRLYVAPIDDLTKRRALPLVGTGQNWAGVWTDDGQRVVFLVGGSEPGGLYWRRADGTGEAERLVDGRAPEGVYGNGRQLAYITLTGNRDYGVSMLDLASRESTPLVDRPGSEQHSSRVSPDLRWIAYVSNETGRQEVWLEPLPQNGKRYQLTRDGGSHRLWSPDGTTLYFDRDRRMYRMRLFFGAEMPKASAPEALRIRGFQQGDLRRQFDLTPDGRRFLLLFPR